MTHSAVYLGELVEAITNRRRPPYAPHATSFNAGLDAAASIVTARLCAPEQFAENAKTSVGDLVERLRAMVSEDGRGIVCNDRTTRQMGADILAAASALDRTREAGAPMPMILHCPRCRLQHIDEPDERTPEWTNPPHRSHLCHGCGCIWRPADVATEGVRTIETVGKADTWIAEMESLAAIPMGEEARLAFELSACGRNVYAMWESSRAVSTENARLREALKGMLTGLGPNGYALPCGAIHTARARAALSHREKG